MSRRLALSITIAIAACGLASPARAQVRPAIAGHAEVGSTALSAASTFDTAAGGHRALTLGGGVHVSKLWRALFVDVAFSTLSKQGERVSIDDGTLVPLGVPLTVRLRHVDVAAGWRWALRRVAIYAGGGVARVTYIESDASEPIDLAIAGTGPLVLTGVEVAVSSWVRIGAELRGRRVGGILGEAGLSAHFAEASAGGVTTALRIAVGR